MAWSTSFKNEISDEENEILLEAKKRFKICENWEAQARVYFRYDYKFANADSNNMYQWDNWVVGDRQQAKRPCLTINKTQQHNLQIINDGKQNKPGVTIRPVGEEASFEAAQVFQEVIDHIQYQSSAENVYDNASKFQVDGGWGYWRVAIEKVNGSFDKEIYIRRIKNPLCVYLDPNINEVDGSDAWFGFIFDDMAKDLYEAQYPKFKDLGNAAFNETEYYGWMDKSTVRVCEYFRKTQEDDKLVYFVLPETQEEIGPVKWSLLDKDARQMFNEIKARESNLPPEERTYQEQDELSEKIEWFKIAGNRIIDRKPWLGAYIPIVRLVGTETVIDGIWDCKGHTRALLDPQRIYNINSSANVEFGALQTKSPIMAPMDAVEGFEEYYNNANTNNAAWLPYNHLDGEGNPIPAPSRMPAPVSSPAYVEQMKIAQEEMMMVSGQYQAQMGQNENAKSGVAINARQRQGDRATYHFIDNQAIAIRFTGRILIDLIPKIYDTKRVMRIEAKDNTIMNVTIDPNAQQPYQKVPTDPNQQPATDNTQQIIEIIFNPNVGKYVVQSDTGPSFATRRQEAFNALTQIAAQNKEFMNIAGDILWKVADFPEAQVLAQRWRKIIPPNITGDAPNPQQEQMMHQAADKIEQQLALIAKQQQELDNKDRELTVKERDMTLREQLAGHGALVDGVEQIRADFDAMSKRITALGNSGPAFAQEQIAPLLKQAVLEALAQHGPVTDEAIAAKGLHEGGSPVGLPQPPSGASEGVANQQQDSLPDVPGSRMAADGKHYIPHQGGYMEVSPLDAEPAGNA
jgi:hypothetical protein